MCKHASLGTSLGLKSGTLKGKVEWELPHELESSGFMHIVTPRLMTRCHNSVESQNEINCLAIKKKLRRD